MPIYYHNTSLFIRLPESTVQHLRTFEKGVPSVYTLLWALFPQPSTSKVVCFYFPVQFFTLTVKLLNLHNLSNSLSGFDYFRFKLKIMRLPWTTTHKLISLDYSIRDVYFVLKSFLPPLQKINFSPHLLHVERKK